MGKRTTVSSLGLKGKSNTGMQLQNTHMGQRNGAITGLNLISPTSNYLASNDLPPGGNNSSMGMTNAGAYGAQTAKNS